MGISRLPNLCWLRSLLLFCLCLKSIDHFGWLFWRPQTIRSFAWQISFNQAVACQHRFIVDTPNSTHGKLWHCGHTSELRMAALGSKVTAPLPKLTSLDVTLDVHQDDIFKCLMTHLRFYWTHIGNMALYRWRHDLKKMCKVQEIAARSKEMLKSSITQQCLNPQFQLFTPKTFLRETHFKA